jgi:D-alanyl-D-alanine carboxypeptidase/D-alanyl-D-alanine-endopeptidase (penicillin-binding protein 4)
LQKLLTKPEYKNATVGISIVDLKNGLPLFELNSEKLMIPASTLKIVTSATALEILRAEYRFKTQVGFIGEMKNINELNGDLVIIGGGDPTLGSEYFRNVQQNNSFVDNWVQKIKSAGIGKINGDIILDSSFYDTDKIPSSWNWGDIGNYYGAGANAFTCYDNLFRITFKSPKNAGEITEIIATNPEIEGLELENEVIASDDNRDLANVFGSPFDKRRVIRGTIPKDKDAFVIKAAIHNPEELLANELIRKLKKEGVYIAGKVLFKKVEKNSFKTIFINESPKLADIIKVLNFESVNLFAEHLVMQIAVEKTGFGNREKGIELIEQFWQSQGINTDNIIMEDGSGLSHFNAVSPSLITSILVFMSEKSENSEVFLNSLPNAGSGTLSAFNTSLFPENTLKAKSGSMTRIRCYAGYLQLDSGDTAAFSIMFNHFLGSHSKLTKEIENLLFTIKKSF